MTLLNASFLMSNLFPILVFHTTDMRSYKLLLPFLLLLLAEVSHAQTAAEVHSKQWLTTITGHAIHASATPGAFAAAPHGLALYYSRVGNVDVPYLVYVPQTYTPARAMPVVVFLHGAILAKDSFQYKDPSIAAEPIFSVADMYHTIVVFPFGRRDLMWPSQVSALENVASIVKQVQDHYNVDKQKIYLGGISMGGISTFWFINHKPDMFAGFYAFSAMPKLPGEAIKFSNITKQKPLFSMNAKDDPGFPFGDVQAIYEQHKNEATGWNFGNVEQGGHRFIYGPGGAKYVYSLLGNLLLPPTKN